MNLLRSYIIFFTLLSLSCMPYYYSSTPHILGKIADENSKEPIEGARVYVKEYQKSAVITKSDGSFDIPSYKKWIIVPLGPFDAVPPHGSLVIDANGYESVQMQDIRGREFNIGELLLKKAGSR